MPNQINRDIYVLSSKVKDPIDYVRLTNDIPIVFTFRDYDILPGSAAQVYVQKPSGKAVYDKATISGNVVTVAVTDQMFAELGVSDLQIRITQGDEKLVSFSQPVRVHPNYTDGDAEQSKNAGGFFDDAEQAVENANAAAESANSAADVANAAAEAVGGAVSGVVNDNQVSEYTTYSSQKLGNFSQLLTTAKNTFVAAINELVLKIGDLKELATTEKTDIVSAINEIEGDKLDKENIANNLTTTRAGYVLDARQGKILDGKIAEKLAKTDVVNGLTETAAGKALDARQGKVLDKKIDDLGGEVSGLNSKIHEETYEQDVLSIAEFYDVSAFDLRRKGNEVFLNVSLSLKSTAQFDANTQYTISTNPIPDDLKASKTYHLQGFGCDSNWGQATAMAVIIDPEGYIKYTAPSRSAFFKLSGHWFTD